MTNIPDLLRRGHALAAQMLRRVSAEFFYRVAAGDRACQVIERRVGEVAMGQRYCVFVHFDTQGMVRQHTRDYLLALRQAGLCIIFVTNAGHLEQASSAWLDKQCALILIRRNRGYDFGAYRDGIAALFAGGTTAELLILANDSLYGPFASLADTLKQMDFAAADVWALTDSWQHRHHLQSYFLAFGPAALASTGFAEFWHDVRNVRSKWSVVYFYEVQMTQRLRSAGLSCAAVWDYLSLLDSIQEMSETPETSTSPPSKEKALRLGGEHALRCWRRRIAVNPTHDLWLELLERNFPFIKRELLRFNPGRSPDLYLWHRIVRARAPETYQRIIADLKLSMSRQVP